MPKTRRTHRSSSLALAGVLALAGLTEVTSAAPQDPAPQVGPPAEGPPVPAPPEAQDAAPADAYEALLARFEAAGDAHKQAIRAERDPAKRRALRSETAEKQLLPEFEALVAGGDGRGLMWIARHASAAGLEPALAKSKREAAVRALAHDYLSAPWVADGLDFIKRYRADIGRSVALEHLEHAHSAAQSPEVKALAAHLITQVLEGSEVTAEVARKAALEALLAGEYATTAYMRGVEAEARAKEDAAEAAAAAASQVKPSNPSEPPAPPREPGVVMGHFAPSLEGTDTEGAQRSVADVSGKVTVVVFFGFWAPTSRELLADLQNLQEQVADAPFAVYGVSAGDTVTAAREWRKKLGLDWTVIVQGLTDAPISQRWQVNEYPECWVLDPKGRVAGRGKGVELRAIVRRELRKLGH
ncbi:MAG: TlpA disulfide reductase family protein [Planctomycetota bacterium]